MYLMQKKAIRLFHKSAEQLDFLKSTVCQATFIEVTFRDVFLKFLQDKLSQVTAISHRKSENTDNIKMKYK